MALSKSEKYLWGFHPVREALRARRRKIGELLIARDGSGRRGRGLNEIADQYHIPCRKISFSSLSAIVGHDRHQGVAADVTPYPHSSLKEILSMAPVQGREHFLLLLDQIVDPQNFGAIARTAHCAGVQGIIVPKDRSCPVTAAAVKASAGALEHLHLAYVTNLAQTMKALKKTGLWIAGADRLGPGHLYHTDLSMSLALVIGGEDKGIRPLVKQQCDFLIAIPQIGPFNSLNASAAAAIILYESVRQATVAQKSEE